MTKKYVQYGCGLSAPKEWVNFDSSPTLQIQKTPIIGWFLKRFLNVEFPNNVLYGDIITGLPIEQESCDGLYCSHVLEHLSLNDFYSSVRNSFKILKTGGIFRIVVPDLELAAREYIAGLEEHDSNASINFIGNNTLIGMEKREKGFKSLISSHFGSDRHLWMWDQYSLSSALLSAGFSSVRVCKFNDSEDKMFLHVEEESRFKNALCIECKK
jgi:SAM-dependent methyltransferase